MKKILYIIIGVSLLILLLALFFSNLFTNTENKENVVEEISDDVSSVKMVNFYDIDENFLFSASIPDDLQVEYIPSLKAINIYNPKLDKENNIEKSQIYITYFRANNFLTLSTVTISQSDKKEINGREAILYEITKKPTVANFGGQPSWRNFTHKALDIRRSKDNPSYFYPFAYNPEFPEEDFNNFISSLVFN